MFYSVCLVRLGEYDEAHRWAQLANVILDSYQSRQLHAKAKYVYWASIQVIKEPVRDTLKPIWDSYRLAMKTGDIEVSSKAD